ncbi:hypothetical protein ABPG72_013483 [Tetrahymena utriculariae]
MDKLQNNITKSQAYANSVKDIEDQLNYDDLAQTQRRAFVCSERKKNLSVVITLQSQTKDIEFIQNVCNNLKIEWINIQLHHKGNQDIFEKKGVDQIIKNGITALRNILAQNKNQVILIHCSAGIRRSGVLSYAILRSLSYDRKESLQKIKSIRKMTFNGLKQQKLDQRDQNVINPI